jgi:hypothetical protein
MFLPAAAAAALLLGSGAAVAAVTTVNAGGYALSDDSFGTGFGVHSNGTQTGNTINAHVNQEGSAVSFTSAATLSDTGAGEAQIDGTMNNLIVDFAHGWEKITFAFSLPNGPGSPDSSVMTLAVNGTTLFTGGASGNCSICTLGANGEQKFTIAGPSITELSFTFDPAIATAKQFRVELSAVPEPASWGMMLLGFLGCGAILRSRRKEFGFAA